MPRVINNVSAVMNNWKSVAINALLDTSQEIMEYANANTVPMLTGRLINSGYYGLYQVYKDRVLVKMSYGSSEGLAGASMGIAKGSLTPKYNSERLNARGIGKTKKTMGQVLYARHWHENQPLHGFNYGRQWQYLSDPLKQMFPGTILSKLRNNL
jgi:hypothetical protein